MSDCVTPQTPLITFEEAIDLLLKKVSPLTQTKQVALPDALGQVLAEEIISTVDVPPLDNSAMDGYAVLSMDVEPGKQLPVSQRIPAGTVGSQLEPVTCARIFTGAPVPSGADAVIMQEQATEHPDESVSFDSQPEAGENIRRAGEDIRKNNAILHPGIRLQPQHLGLAASVGVRHINVYRQLKVATFFTGDELVEPGTPLQQGEIYNSNQYQINALLQLLGCEVINLGIVEDTLEATRETLRQAAQQADLVITSGGVSVGEEDHVRKAIEELGEINMWRLKIKPGKPLVFGRVESTPFLGLPGNPVSAFATFCLFVRPYILGMQGISERLPKTIKASADFEWKRPGIRREFLRARLSNDQTVSIYPHQGSGVLSSVCWANGLAVVAEDTTVAKGDAVSFIPFAELLT